MDSNFLSETETVSDNLLEVDRLQDAQKAEGVGEEQTKGTEEGGSMLGIGLQKSAQISKPMLNRIQTPGICSDSMPR